MRLGFLVGGGLWREFRCLGEDWSCWSLDWDDADGGEEGGGGACLEGRNGSW